jgi:uncharacterized protein (DUF1499 family)
MEVPVNSHQNTIRHTLTEPGSSIAYLAPLGLSLAALSGIAAALAGIGTRFGIWHFTTGLSLLQWSAIGGLVGAGISLLGGIAVRHETHRKALVLALAGFLIGLVAAGIPLSWMRLARQLPPIHDITTDPVNPPLFAAIMPLRANADNPAEYGGQAIANQQRAAYPDISTVVLPLPPAMAFERALKAAQSMGWKIVDANAEAGRIEAMARTFWFGFTDDMVVRIAAAAGGSKVDVRSVSRVGLGDLGTNANRIRHYMLQLRHYEPGNKGATNRANESIGY